MKHLVLAAVLLATSPALAQQAQSPLGRHPRGYARTVAADSGAQAQAPAAEQPAIDPEKQALAYQLQQCRTAGDQTATGAFTVAAKLEAETKRADAEKKRADDAEAKLKVMQQPAEGK